jgi:hypothetical protein
MLAAAPLVIQRLASSETTIDMKNVKLKNFIGLSKLARNGLRLEIFVIVSIENAHLVLW